MKLLNKTLVLMAFILCAFSVQSQTDSLAKPKLVISGYLDAYYNVSFDNPGVGATLWGPAAGSRAFDINNNQFSLGIIQGKFDYTNHQFEVVADLVAGPNASLLTLASFTSNTYASGSLGGGAFGVKQLYGVYKPSDKLSFTIGQFGTQIGYEVIESSINYNYSLSNLFNNGPFFHTGLKMNYAVSDKFGFMVGLVNTWDSFDDNNAFKSPVVQLSFFPVQGLSIYLNYLTGKGDRAGSGVISNALIGSSKPEGFSTSIYDLTASYIAGKATFGINAAAGSFRATASDLKPKFKAITKGEKDSPTFSGIAGYFNIAASDKFSIGTRIEQYNDYYGVRYLGGNNTSLTFTGTFTLANGSLLLKPELRLDSATGKNNVNGHVDLYNGKDGTTDSQQTLGLSTIFKF
ncbi:MAG: outer membrane beta-barrel protein [Saprospiraceae bacterium]